MSFFIVLTDSVFFTFSYSFSYFFLFSVTVIVTVNLNNTGLEPRSGGKLLTYLLVTTLRRSVNLW